MNMRRIPRQDAEELYRAHSKYVRNVAYFLCQSRSLADDITQETFLRVFQSYHRYNPTRPIRPWIHQIAVNVTKSALRSKGRGGIPSPDLDSSVKNLKDDTAVDPLQSVLLDERQRDLWQAMNQLTLKAREIIVLRYFAGLKISEIATYLGIPENTCKSRLNSALVSLRGHYDGDNDDSEEVTTFHAERGE